MRCKFCGAEMRETRLRESAPEVALWACPMCGAFSAESVVAAPGPGGLGAEGEVRVARRAWRRESDRREGGAKAWGV